MTVTAQNTSVKTTKVAIPHPQDERCTIVGTLEQVEPERPTQGRNIALVRLHALGTHKDYLFQKKLALRLPYDSFRFDFRGNHETPGEWRFGHFEDDLADLDAIVAYLAREYGYVVDMLVGHSRGSVVAMLWLCRHRDGPLTRAVRRFVNVSGRYRMEIEERKEEFEKLGYIERRAMVARKPFVARIYQTDFDKFAAIDTSVVWTQFPPHIDVLSLHGLKDAVVPSYDAFIYSRAYGARVPGTHLLRYVEDADHNFTGMPEEVIETVLEWMELQEQDRLYSGVWNTGVKGKL
ncbi:ectomycorrhiza-regulated esterase [Epithele typhae]|uniref:ectomycorrhiza-regulated esterase n=1 Tax=Epithele typhae TaxID=378194 RepID=UPI002008B198|nr:ectomycorrhiza-regulated esterase [Epithele typhae]KAH9933107.1 ectomycorrhiza-regulated esterase [Epithele typhae]